MPVSQDNAGGPIPSRYTERADPESWQMNARIEWTLAKNLFAKIQTRFYTLEVDQFASWLNHQISLYAARRPDAGEMALDAFILDWSCGHRSYTLRWFCWTGSYSKFVKTKQQHQHGWDSRGTRHCWRCWSTCQLNFRHQRRQYFFRSTRPLFAHCGRR